MSLGLTVRCYVDELLKILADEHKILLVVAAGNIGDEYDLSDETYPQCFAPRLNNMILVGASDKNTYRASFSSLNNMQQRILYAPGAFVYKPDKPDGSYSLGLGTSFGKLKEEGTTLRNPPVK